MTRWDQVALTQPAQVGPANADTASLPTIERKCQQYLRYRRTGRLQRDLGVFPLVLWVVPDDLRAEALSKLWRRSPDTDAALFRVATSADVARALCGGAT